MGLGWTLPFSCARTIGLGTGCLSGREEDWAKGTVALPALLTSSTGAALELQKQDLKREGGTKCQILTSPSPSTHFRVDMDADAINVLLEVLQLLCR